MIFKVGDILVNKHTGEPAKVIKYEPEWYRPVYEVQYIESGEISRFNVQYIKHWDIAMTTGGEDE
jgi:hypothetical protein